MTRRVIVVPDRPNWLAAGIGLLVFLCLPVMAVEAVFEGNWIVFLVVLFFLIVLTMAIVAALVHIVSVGSAHSVHRRARHRVAEEERIAADPRAWTQGEN